MNCPKCNSESVEESSKFDHTMIYSTECHHDFECNDCGCLFVIIYKPVATKIVTLNEEHEPKSKGKTKDYKFNAAHSHNPVS